MKSLVIIFFDACSSGVFNITCEPVASYSDVLKYIFCIITCTDEYLKTKRAMDVIGISHE